MEAQSVAVRNVDEGGRRVVMHLTKQLSTASTNTNSNKKYGIKSYSIFSFKTFIDTTYIV